MLLEKLKSKAIEKRLINEEDDIGAERAFQLVRDMPYTRASSRDPEIIIAEWRGTCSGKHYLLKSLFAELGYSSRLIACTSVTHLDPNKYQGKLRKLLKKSNGRFVDVHNYLILELPDGEMIVDATWPISTKGMGTVINEGFVLGENHKIATIPLETWDVPKDRDPQDFKNEILHERFSPEELIHREEFIKTISELSNSKISKFMAWLRRVITGQGSD